MQSSNYRTEIKVSGKKNRVRLDDSMLLMGSCFSTNIGNRLQDSGYDCMINPFGVLYNPASIILALEEIIQKKVYTEDDLFFENGKWHSFMHHSSFSNKDKNECLNGINQSIKEAHEKLKSVSFLGITFGTAWVYELIEKQQIVGNCHRVPANKFERFRLSPGDIVNEFQQLIARIIAFNPNINILFTVSPIRHLKDGFNGNQISKSTLLLAVEHICYGFKEASYFPAYEIMMDDLRDYRFYEEDMVHPSKLAIDYIWQKFEESHLEENQQLIRKFMLKVQQFINHKNADFSQESYQNKIEEYLHKLDELSEILEEGKLKSIQAILKERIVE